MAVLLQASLPLQAYTRVQLIAGKEPAVRYISGSMVCREALHEGRWRNRYFSADGRLKVSAEGWWVDAFGLTLNGQAAQTGWEWVELVELEKHPRGARHVVVRLLNKQHSCAVNVHTLLDGTEVMTRWLEITNRGNKPASLDGVYPWTGRLWPRVNPRGIPAKLKADPELDRFVMGRDFSLGYFTRSHWAHEGWFEWQTLKAGTTTIYSDVGVGHDDPFFVVRNDDVGEYFIAHLAWTANYKMNFNRDEQGLTFSIGPAAKSALRVIDPGETIKTPAVHLGYVSGTFDDAVQVMHEHLRKTVLPARRADHAHLIEYLVPADQGYYIPFDEASAFKCVNVAAAIGAELFVLDAYWWDVTMEWTPSTRRFPRGLKPLIDYVHSKKMLFGLYVETEGGRGNIEESQVFKAHPEWFGPNNVIQLSNPEAARWVEADTRRIIENYDLDLLRIDFNPYHIGEGATTRRRGIEENNFWRYYQTLYGIYERIHEDYPDLILQQCAAGGARNDLGMASRFHENYLTDGLSLPLELLDYAGLSLGLPPENFVILHGADGGFSMGKPQLLDTILRVTYTLSTPLVFVGVVAPDVESLSPHRRERFRRYGQLYKKFIRPLLPQCKVFHHAPINAARSVTDGDWFVIEFAAPDRTRGWATLARVDVKQPQQKEFLFKPRGLDPARQYQVTFDSLQSTVKLSGLELIRDGVPVRLEDMASSEVLLFEAIKRDFLSRPLGGLKVRWPSEDGAGAPPFRFRETP